MNKCIRSWIIFFPKHQCGIRKGYNAQHCLLVMIEKMNENRDKIKSVPQSYLIYQKYMIV